MQQNHAHLDHTIGPPGESQTTAELIGHFSSHEGRTRKEARRVLAGRGVAAIPELIQALTTGPELVRWEASKTLCMIAHPSSAPALVRSMRLDENFGVRWDAAEALIAMERRGLVPLLIALGDFPASVWLREGAHHVLSELNHHDLVPDLLDVLDALERPAAREKLPVLALDALKRLTAEPAGTPPSGPLR